MKLTIAQNALAVLLKPALTVVPRKSTLPISLHFKLEARAESSELSITANANGETVYSSTVPCSVQVSGGLCVVAKDLTDIVRKMPDGDLTLEAAGVPNVQNVLEHPSELRIQSCKKKRCKFTLLAMPAEDFPVWDQADAPGDFAHFTPSELSRKLAGVVYAACLEETRYYLGGVYFHPKMGGGYRLVCTDGHRLACQEIHCHEGSGSVFVGSRPMGPDEGVIIPLSFANTLIKVLDAHRKDSELVAKMRVVNGTVIQVEVGDTELQSLAVHGSFPDYEQVVPKGGKSFYLERLELKEALERVLLTSPDGTAGVRWEIKAEVENPEEGLVIASKHTGRGHSQDSVALLDWKGGLAVECGYNASYWVAALAQMDSARIQIAYTNHLSPALARPVDHEHDPIGGGFHVIMPVRL